MAVKAELREMADRLTQQLADDGMLVAGGFVAFKQTVLDPDAPLDQIMEMRLAFYAGAQHVFHSLMGSLDEDDEPTEADMDRFAKLDDELTKFANQMAAAFQQAQGTA